MNVYFLVEGKRCERKLYPSWLAYAVPHLRRVSALSQVVADNYFLVSGEGYPSILGDHLPNAIKDVETVGVFDYLVVVLDAEEQSVAERRGEVQRAVQRSRTRLRSARLEILVQNRCLETWLLGNRRMFVRQAGSQELRRYIAHYDVHVHDPEQMPAFQGFSTHAQFHLAYLKAIFGERSMVYSKNNPGHAADASYFEQLRHRVQECPGHLATFASFVSLCERLVPPVRQPRCWV